MTLRIDLTTAPSPSLTAIAAAIAATTSPLIPASTCGAFALLATAFGAGAGVGSLCLLFVIFSVFPFLALASALETIFPNA